MEQHPVPQHIASFEFKLFGNLTIKQFVTLAIPMSLAALVFFSNLPPIISYPLALTFGVLGFIAAFIPIQGRSFDKWIVAFFRAITKPTLRIWVKEEQIPEFLKVVTRPIAPSESPITQESEGQSRAQLMAYLKNLPGNRQSTLDIQEQQAITGLGLEQVSPQTSLPTISDAPQPSIIKPTEEKRQELAQVTYEGKMGESLPPIQPKREQVRFNRSAKPFVLPGVESRIEGRSKIQASDTVDIFKSSTSQTKPKANIASDTNFSIENIIPIHTPGRRIELIHGIGKTRVRKLHMPPPEGFKISRISFRGEKNFDISQDLKDHFTQNTQQTPQVTSAQPHPQPQVQTQNQPQPQPTITPPQPPPPVKPVITPQQKINQKSEVARVRIPKPQAKIIKREGVSLAPEIQEQIDSQFKVTKMENQSVPSGTFSKAQIIPLTNKPNVLSGLVTKTNGDPVEGAIIIVHDSNAIPVRALKSNQLGQFLSATPLGSGTYTLDIESADAQFSPVKLNLTGEVMDPLEIKADS